MYKPYCAFACRDFLAGCRLDCSEDDDHDDDEHHHSAHTRRHPGHVARFETSVECRASGDAFLESLAWCLSTRCEHEAVSDLDRFWHVDAVGSGAHQPVPKYGYAESLAKILEPPTQIISHDEVLNSSRLVPEEDWRRLFGKLKMSAENETRNTRNGFTLIALSVFLPLLLTFLGFLLRSTPLEAWVLRTLVYPALMGTRHLVPLPLDVGLMPYRGQAALISTIILTNLILSSTGYTFSVEGSSYEPTRGSKAETVANRVGILAFANLFIMILYCLRNNPLLRLTGWSRGTFLLYHRWTAYLCMLQASTHGTIYWIMHIGVLDKKLRQGYWNAGLFTVLSLFLILLLSALPVRRRLYEVFLDSHVGFALAVLTGLYCHIDWHFGHAWGYENWIYLAAATWGLERLIRLVIIVKNGLRMAEVSVIDDEYLAVTVPGVQATGNAYLYFPTLSWRVWENHPFSIASSVQEATDVDFEDELVGDASEFASRFELVGSDSDSESGDADEKQQADDAETGRFLTVAARDQPGQGDVPPTPATPHSGVALLTQAEREAGGDLYGNTSRPVAGLTFYVKREKGMTRRLARFVGRRLPVLVETSHEITLPASRIAACPRLLCVVGGAGITATLPLLRSRAGMAPARTSVYWGCRSEALVRQAGIEALSGAAMEVFVRVGQRWDVKEIVRREAENTDGELVVLVSGPSQMADEVRQAIVDANRGRAKRGDRGVVRLVEECFSW
ncbi:ferric reductase transmembrane component 6 [Plectosphaerella plurivora]|uniref:Ferric reductase transmembrane component 6 n=1 Tax=Plectosphaerella plurivora TaxID=936078 RepID=A0A9P8V4S9_9PEZI|nr:ferric reductase transmembrane component 6 [Plectosphaerella plurivora]